MQWYTIVNAFSNSGMWPFSLKAGLKKMRAYGKKKRSIHDVESNDPELLKLPPSRPHELWNTAAAI